MHRSTFLLWGLALANQAIAQTQEPAAAPAVIAPTALALQADFAAIAKRVFPTVVTVRTFVRVDPTTATTEKATNPVPDTSGWVAAPTFERDYPGFKPHSSGSGFFVGTTGDILTCLSPLLAGEEKLVDLIEVETNDDHRILCEVQGIEPTLQLAVLRGAVFPNWDRPSMPGLQFADSDETEVGNLLLGFGDPLGPERFMATGILVAKPSRDCYQELMSATYLQATMHVHPGAYGGPLVDLHGNLAGILTKLDLPGMQTPGCAWALPSKILEGLYESIKEAGTTRSPWLGFSVMSRAEIATARGLAVYQQMMKPPHGILLENVFAPGPAHAAGVLPEDFLTHFQGKEIHAPVDFQRQLYLAGVGSKVELRFFRRGESFTRELVIEARPPAAQPR